MNDFDLFIERFFAKLSGLIGAKIWQFAIKKIIYRILTIAEPQFFGL